LSQANTTITGTNTFSTPLLTFLLTVQNSKNFQDFWSCRRVLFKAMRNEVFEHRHQIFNLGNAEGAMCRRWRVCLGIQAGRDLPELQAIPFKKKINATRQKKTDEF